MHEAKEVVLAYLHIHKDDWGKSWSTQPLERVN